MSGPLNIVFIGQESAGLQALQVIADSEHCIAGVFTSEASSSIGGAGVHRFASQQQMTLWPGDYVKDERAAEALAGVAADLVINVHSLYKIHDSVLALPKLGAFNLHPGPLPRLAGLNSISWAIYLGERQHGVTLHHMTSEIDGGAIAYQTLFDVSDADTPVTIMSKCAKAGAEMIGRLLEDASGEPPAIPSLDQDRSQRSYYGRETPQGGRIDWSKPAREVVNFVRACDYHPFPSPWGHPVTGIGDVEVAILKAAVTGTPSTEPPGAIEPGEDGSLRVACADDWVRVTKVRVNDGPARTVDVLNIGHRFEANADACRPQAELT